MLAVGLEGSTFGRETLVRVAERHKITQELKKALINNQSASLNVVTLPEGYNCKAHLWIGAARTLAVWDTGACRNGINDKYLRALLHEPRSACAVEEIIDIAPTKCVGAFSGTTKIVNKVVKLRVTLKEHSGGSQVQDTIAALVLPDCQENLIIGKPTLDRWGFVSTKEAIDLRTVGIGFPTILPESGGAEFLNLTCRYSFEPAPGQTVLRSVEGQLPRGSPALAHAGQQGDPTYWVTPGPACPESCQVVEGPLILDAKGNAKVDLLIHGPTRLGPGQELL